MHQFPDANLLPFATAYQRPSGFATPIYRQSPRPRSGRLSVCAIEIMKSLVQSKAGVQAPAGKAWLAPVCAAAAVLFLILLGLDLRRSHGNTFSVFYFAAKAIATGGNIYISHSPGSDRHEYVYPPLFAVLVLPLTYFKVATATRIWTFIDACLTILALILGSIEAARRFHIPATRATVSSIVAVSMLLGIGEIKTELATSQTDTLVLICFVLALAWLDQWPLLCGLALGFSCNIKYQTLIALPYLLLTRRWKAAASAAISSVSFALLPGLLVGFGRNIEYLRSALGGLGHFAGIDAQGAASTVSLTWIRSVSITSAIGRALATCGISSCHAFLLAALVALVCFGVARQLYRQHGIAMFPTGPSISHGINPMEGLVALEWTGLMVVWLVFGPEVSRRHMYVLLLMDVIAVALLIASRGRQRWVLIAGMLLCQAGLRIPSGTGSGSLTDAFNWAGGASWCLLGFYGTLLYSCFVWFRSLSASPISEAAAAIQIRSGSDWRVQGLSGIEHPATLAARPD